MTRACIAMPAISAAGRRGGRAGGGTPSGGRPAL